MNFFLKWILRILLLIIALIGNLIGILIFSRKSFRKKIKSYLFYILVASIDSIYIIYAILKDLLSNLEIKLVLFSKDSCKIIYYLNYSIGPISAWILVFISIEKYISIRYPKFIFIYELNLQIILMLLILFFNLAYYLPITFFTNIYYDFDNLTNITRVSCHLIKKEDYAVINLIDFFNSTLIPFIFMVIFSTLLIHTILRSRQRILRYGTNLNRNQFRKDVKFAISSITLNIFFVVTNAPICIGNFIDSISNDSDLFQSFYCIYYISFIDNFYVFYFTNSIFRNEVHRILNIKK